MGKKKFYTIDFAYVHVRKLTRILTFVITITTSQLFKRVTFIRSSLIGKKGTMKSNKKKKKRILEKIVFPRKIGYHNFDFEQSTSGGTENRKNDCWLRSFLFRTAFNPLNS